MAKIALSGNAITEIPRDQLVGNLELEILYLARNRISTIPDLYHLPLTDLYLAGNPLVCDNALCWIRMWPWMKPPLVTDAITCETPDSLQHALLMDINPITLTCQMGGSYRTKMFSLFISYQIDYNENNYMYFQINLTKFKSVIMWYILSAPLMVSLVSPFSRFSFSALALRIFTANGNKNGSNIAHA